MKKKKRDANWTTVKYQLLSDYGNMCWLCHRRFTRDHLTIHHVHAFKDTKKTTYEDSCILCWDCHFGVVNSVQYNSEEYWKLMKKIADGMNSMFDVDIEFKK